MMSAFEVFIVLTVQGTVLARTSFHGSIQSYTKSDTQVMA